MSIANGKQMFRPVYSIESSSVDEKVNKINKQINRINICMKMFQAPTKLFIE